MTRTKTVSKHTPLRQSHRPSTARASEHAVGLVGFSLRFRGPSGACHRIISTVYGICVWFDKLKNGPRYTPPNGCPAQPVLPDMGHVGNGPFCREWIRHSIVRRRRPFLLTTKSIYMTVLCESAVSIGLKVSGRHQYFLQEEYMRLSRRRLYDPDSDHRTARARVCRLGLRKKQLAPHCGGGAQPSSPRHQLSCATSPSKALGWAACKLPCLLTPVT